MVAAEYEGGLEDFHDASDAQLGRIAGVGSHIYVVDDLPVMGLDRAGLQGRNYNITFATDGLSYEVRAEWATQSSTLSRSGEAIEY